jgi:hypothetical protein
LFKILELSSLTTVEILKMKYDTNQTIMKAVQKIQEDDTCSTFETALTVKTYNTKDCDEHRKEKFANLQYFHDEKLPLSNFQWHVKHILKKYILDGELYYLVRYFNTNMNDSKHNYECPLE